MYTLWMFVKQHWLGTALFVGAVVATILVWRNKAKYERNTFE